MNTVTIDGQQRDDKNWGLLAAVAVVYRLTRSGLGLRAQYNHVEMPGYFDTDTIMAGLTQELGGESRPSAPARKDGPDVFGVWMGSVITNRGGQKGHLGYQAEFQRPIDRRFSYSFSLIAEGDSGLNERYGAASQVWFVAPTAGKLKFSAGIGPYVALEMHPGDEGAKLLAIVSVRAARQVGKNVSISCRMNRMVSGYDKDADNFFCGLEFVN